MFADFTRMNEVPMYELMDVKVGDEFYYTINGEEPIGCVYKAKVVESYKYHFLLDLYPVIETLETDSWFVSEKNIKHTKVSFSRFDGTETYAIAHLYKNIVLLDDEDEM